MDISEAMKMRHSVRRYKTTPLSEEIKSALCEEIESCNREGKLHIQLVTDEPRAFDSFLAHYGKFSGVTNYIALVGENTSELWEKCGYYGERLVLKAQQLGLNTCWVALSYKKISGVFKVEQGEKLTAVIAIGYGETSGAAHKSKPIEAVSNITADSPEWFVNGVKAALLAPTAMNQQQFYLTQSENKVSAKAKAGFYTKLDLGIVKYHFELGAGKDCFEWK